MGGFLADRAARADRRATSLEGAVDGGGDALAARMAMFAGLMSLSEEADDDDVVAEGGPLAASIKLRPAGFSGDSDTNPE